MHQRSGPCISGHIFFERKGVAGVNLADFFAGIRSQSSESGEGLVKVDAIVTMSVVKSFKQPFSIPKGGCKKRCGIVLIDGISPFMDPLNDRLICRMVFQFAGHYVNMVPPSGQPCRLLKEHPLRSADFILDGNIGNKDNIQGLWPPIPLLAITAKNPMPMIFFGTWRYLRSDSVIRFRRPL